MALYKVPAAKQINKYALSAWSYLFATIGAGAALYASLSFDPATILFAFIWGTGYAVLTLLQMHVLHLQDTSSVFPFTSLASNILVVLGGIFLLHDQVTPLQWIAITLAIFLFFGFYWRASIRFATAILPFFLGISLLSTVNKFVQKAGAVHVNLFNFIFWQLAFAFLSSLAILWYMRKDVRREELTHRNVIPWSLVSGLLQFGSTYVIVLALSTGPISLVYVILGLYTFFTSLIASFLFKEKITMRGLLFIVLSFLIVLLIKFG
jgi:drug/metabolite transporter (DMT)-like permease